MKNAAVKAGAVLLCLTLIFALASCGGGGTDTTTVPASTGEAVITTAAPVSGTASVSVICDKTTVSPGEEFTISLVFKDTTDVSGYVLFVDFNYDLITYVGADHSGSAAAGFSPTECGVTTTNDQLSFYGMTIDEKGTSLNGENKLFTVTLKLSESAVKGTELSFPLTAYEFASISCSPAYNGLTLTVK